MLESSSRISWSQVIAVLAALWGFSILRRIFRLAKVALTPSEFPKLYTPLYPFSFPGGLLTSGSWNDGRDWHWVRRFQTYRQSETVLVVPILSGKPSLWSSNIDIGRQVAAGGHRSDFIKPPYSTRTLHAWGMNIASAEGSMWRKHRRIVGPAFGPELYKLVWNKTLEIYREMVEVEGWKNQNVVEIPVVQKITAKLAFLLISTCGFGFSSTWEDSPQTADGAMPIQEALKIVAETSILFTFLPKWLRFLPISGMKEGRLAQDRLRVFMQDQVTERKGMVASGDKRADAFTIMVKSNQDESSKYQLDDSELIGNVFVMLFAGHETTANSLAVTLGYMAIREDIQNEVVEQIMSVLGPTRDPDYNDYLKLDKVLAIFYEATRMIPAGHVLFRGAAEDTVLTVPNSVGEEGTKTVPVAKDTTVIIDMVGVQYNPRYFEDPEEFKPSRWYGLPADSEQYTAFSVGPRACLGRRFATVEGTCFLAMLLRDWQVLPVLRDGETKEAWRVRVLNDVRVSITMKAGDFPIKLARRKPF
ncbi:Cytochrome P450 [Mycena sanguinolenta]|uniref:Cytochrome P450 n=1 Tax=Mycena sanguinolenta TaxID=230812 RepID=A0A8H6XMS3_9AGAR|nr:Cytochrome P450 [Mycena sanguinolenta]